MHVREPTRYQQFNDPFIRKSLYPCQSFMLKSMLQRPCMHHEQGKIPSLISSTGSLLHVGLKSEPVPEGLQGIKVGPQHQESKVHMTSGNAQQSLQYLTVLTANSATQSTSCLRSGGCESAMATSGQLLAVENRRDEVVAW